MTNSGAADGSTADAHIESDGRTRQVRPGFGPAWLRAFLAQDPWGGPLILGLITGVLRLVAPGPPWTTLLILAVGVGAIVPMAYRATVSTGSMRGAWVLFALSVLCAIVTLTLYPLDDVASVGLVRSVLDSGTYVFGVLGVVTFARGFGSVDPDAWLDATMVGVVLSLVVLEFVLPPGILAQPGRPPLFPIAVAALDAVIFTMLARFVIRPVAHLSLSGLGILVGLVLVVDATYYATGAALMSRPAYEAMWMIAYGAWAATAIHPDAAKLFGGGPIASDAEREIRNAYRSVAGYPLAFVAVVLLLWSDINRHAGDQAPIVLGGLALLTAITVLRSFRVVRRLAEDNRQRIAVEHRLRASEERFRRLAEAAPVGIFVADASGRTEYQNDALNQITGQPPGSMVDLSVSVHPEDQAIAHTAWADAVASGASATVDTRVVRPDGTIAWAQVRAVPLNGEDGRVSGWIGTVADVTGLKDAIAAAQEREAFFDELIEQSPIGIGVYGLDGSLIGHNPSKRRVRERIGAPLEVVDIRSDPLMLRLGQGDAIRHAYAAERMAGEPTAVWAPLAGTTGDGDGERLWLRFSWYPLCDADGRLLAVISFVEDVTETVESFARERRVSGKLQEAQKLEALGVLAGGIAHDFNNLLVPIIGYVDLALEALPPGSAVVADLDAARVAASRAADLARQMLAYSGRGSFAIGPVALEELLGEIGELMARSIAKSARLRYEFEPGLPPVLADVTQLRQVALNLIVNASDALDGGQGDITLRTAMVTLAADDPDVVPGSSAEPGEYVLLEVSDTGYGMDEATRARIFDPFFSTKSVGRGLGLAATMGIVKGHGGALRVRSVLGSGSTFGVLLRPSNRPALVAPPEPERAPERGATGQVLVVDDEPAVREIGRRILERAGFTVDEASDGPEAIERFRREPDRFDSILLDLTLPTLDGLTVMRQMRVIRPGVPVVLCSGWSADEFAGSLREVPHTVFLQKPYQGQALVEALATVARRPVQHA